MENPASVMNESLQEEFQGVPQENGDILYLLDIQPEQKGIRIDKIVAEALDLSRAFVSSLVEEKRIRKGSQPLKASYKVQTGEQIEVLVPPLQEVAIEAEDIPLDIVYEDSDLLVINKPSGMVVHPSPGHTSGTLVNALMHHCTDLSGLNGEMRPGIVHRIDKDTSGLLVVAKNDFAHAKLAEQLADKSCRREYLAIVHHPFSHSTGVINAPIGRDPKDRQKMAVTDKNSKDAVTHFRVLENFKDYALVECSLETGRTHQIRVHMNYIQHPVAADPKYGPRNTLQGNGQFLHAKTLEFIHPRSGEKMRFQAEPEAEFQQALRKLQEENR